MDIKANPQGFLIYAAMAVYLIAFIITVAGSKKFGRAIYALGFVIVVIAFGYRWQHVQHVPLQNLFEVFLCMGMIYPLSVFCRRFLRVGAEAADMMIGVIVLFPAGFVFNAEPQQLPPALQSWLFAPHVFVYMFSYVLMAKATVQAVAHLIKSEITSEKVSTPFYVGSIFLGGIATIISFAKYPDLLSIKLSNLFITKSPDFFLPSSLISFLYIFTQFFKYVFAPLLIICGIFAITILWYRAWHAIKDGQVRTTPGRAVGFMFIPLFNLYWIFRLIWGFAKDYNSYISRHEVKAKKFSEGYFIVCSVLFFIPSLLCEIICIDALLHLMLNSWSIWDILFIAAYLFQITLVVAVIGLLVSLLIVYQLCQAIRVINPNRISWPINPELVDYERASYRVISLGFPLLTLGLILGSYWGKWAWGDFWGWDPKELWSLVSWLVYLGYLHFRYMNGKKYPRTNSILALVGMVAIVITLLLANLSDIFAGLHSYAT